MQMDITDDTSTMTEPQKLYVQKTLRFLVQDIDAADKVLPNVLFAVEHGRDDALIDLLDDYGISLTKFKNAADMGRANPTILLERDAAIRRMAREKRHEEEWKAQQRQEKSLKDLSELGRYK